MASPRERPRDALPAGRVHSFPQASRFHGWRHRLPARPGGRAVDSAARDGRLRGDQNDGVVVALSDGERLPARHLVLAMALEQTAPFVRMLGQAEGARSALGVMEMFSSIPCLALIAGYDTGVPGSGLGHLLSRGRACAPPHKQRVFKETGRPVHASLSSRRRRPGRHEGWNSPKEEWSRELLGIVSRRLGSWSATPRWTHPHRWRYGRLDRANELVGPLELRVGASLIGIAGDLFSPGGGLQAAWLSGERLGLRLAESPLA